VTFAHGVCGRQLPLGVLRLVARVLGLPSRVVAAVVEAGDLSRLFAPGLVALPPALSRARVGHVEASRAC
jgi:hypothetical protein